MPEWIEPLRQEKKLNSYLDTFNYSNVGILFPHGVGDVIQFRCILNKLRELYSNIRFTMILSRGLNQEIIIPDADLSSKEELENSDYDLIVTIHMPVETDPNCTKSELCCKEEIGIDPVWGHPTLPKFPNHIVGLHYNITCLPELANVPPDIGELIWNEILEVGWIPIETHFEHIFHNPVNAKHSYVDATVRRCKPTMENLIGLIQNCGVFMGVVSGNFHVALSCLPTDRIAFLQKEIPVERFTHHKIKVIDVKNYEKGIVREWLSKFP